MFKNALCSGNLYTIPISTDSSRSVNLKLFKNLTFEKENSSRHPNSNRNRQRLQTSQFPVAEPRSSQSRLKNGPAVVGNDRRPWVYTARSALCGMRSASGTRILVLIIVCTVAVRDTPWSVAIHDCECDSPTTLTGPPIAESPAIYVCGQKAFASGFVSVFPEEDRRPENTVLPERDAAVVSRRFRGEYRSNRGDAQRPDNRGRNVVTSECLPGLPPKPR